MVRFAVAKVHAPGSKIKEMGCAVGPKTKKWVKATAQN
jgi:hypothetical protein